MRCGCGCGHETKLSTRTRNGYKRGDPMRYLRGHALRKRPPGILPPGAKIDDVDLALLADRTWFVNVDGYVAGHVDDGVAKHRRVLLHRLIVQQAGPIPSGCVPDHINRDKLDNRRANLRVVALTVNAQNSGLSVRNKSGERGVVYVADCGRRPWRVSIQANGKRHYIGYFATFETAAEAARRARLQLHDSGVAPLDVGGT